MSGWRGKTRGGIYGYRIFVFLIRRVGLNAAYFILFFVSAYFLIAAPNATRSIYSYLRKVQHFGRCKSAFGVLKTYYVFGQTLIDKVAIGAGMLSKFKFKFDGRENLDVLTDRGGIVLSAHLGNWEVAGFILGDKALKTNILMFQAEHEHIRNFLQETMTEYKIHVIAIKNDLSHIFELNDVLLNKEVVCIHGDRYLDGSRIVKKVFMGHEAYFPIGPFRIAGTLNYPSTVAFAFREKNRTYQLSASPVQESNMKPEDLMDLYIDLLESKLRKHPYQWFNFYDFWNFNEGQKKAS